jgi:exo-beta-1,3-glucanase (GH17 family)
MTSSSDMGRTRRISAVIAIAAIVALVNAVAWWWLNRPVQGEGWDGQIQGVAYNPFRPGQKPFKGPFPTAEQIAEDLTLLAPQVRRIRTYSVLDGLDAVPAVAADFGLPVTLGVWLDTSATRNEAELEQLGRVLSSAHNIERIIVGNEAILRGDLTAEQLSAYLRTSSPSTSCHTGKASTSIARSSMSACGLANSGASSRSTTSSSARSAGRAMVR